MTAASTTPPDGGTVDPDGTPPAGTAPDDPGSATPPTQGAPASEQGGAPPKPGGASDNRFLLWLRSLDLPRRPGWIGGVCAGIADRLGIDPLIVRGVFVVVAVLGGPAFLFYAAAWLLLPDEDGALPVEQLLRGHLDRVHAGIGVLILASMLPVAQGFWSLGGAYTGATPWAPTTGRALWTAVVVALAIGFVVWIVRRSGSADRVTPPTAGPAADPAAGGTGAAPLLAPPRPTDARPSSPEELDEWRERQEAWKAEREAFRAQQSATARETAAARAEEARLRAHAITAARLERRRLHREANPRLRPSATLLVLGAAALAGALASLTASGPTATVVGFATAGLVLGLAVVIAGLLRRRAVLLIALSLVAVLTAATASLLPPDRQLLPLLDYASLSNAAPGRYAQLAGHLDITVDPALGGSGGSLDIWQGTGDVTVTPLEGAAVRIEAASAGGYPWITTRTGSGDDVSEEPDVSYAGGVMRWSQTFGDPDAEPFVVRIDQGSGSIGVYDISASTEAPTSTEAPSTDAPTSSEAPTSTEAPATAGTTADPSATTDITSPMEAAR